MALSGLWHLHVRVIPARGAAEWFIRLLECVIAMDHERLILQVWAYAMVIADPPY